ncbi:MAG: copper chaperone PCu(A)C, partial [Candidatus Tectimicrobiota bacterium]
EGGVMKMQPVRSVTVPVGGKVELKPGGVHLMLINLKRNLTAGDRFEVMLTFEKSGSMTVASEVRQP